MLQNGNLSGNVAMYLRLSRDDGDKMESDSIQSQRELIKDFLNKNKRIKYVGEYKDDGYTGTNFNRPSFIRMMNDVERGRINCVVVKDLSRLGRNYIETGRYLERIFPSLGLRVIAINDNYDSADNASDDNQIIVPFKNLINDAYCRDISMKIRSHFDVKRRSGQFIGSFAGYGYVKDPKNKNHLIVDDYASKIVEMIFDMKLSGLGLAAIAEKLDEMGVQPPFEYKRKCGLNFNSGFRSTESAKWPIETVLRILKNELYIGTMAQGKNRKINYKVKKSLLVDKDHWICVEGTHDAIISKAKFDAVQELLKMDTRTSPEQSAVYPLSGYVKCGSCGQNMIRRTATAKGKKYYYYHCTTFKNGGCCTSHNINLQQVTDAVLDEIRNRIKLLDKAEAILNSIGDIPKATIGVRTLDKQLSKLKEEIEYYGTLKAKLYRDMVDEIISKEEFAELNARFSKSREEVEKAYNDLQKKRKDVVTGRIRLQPWIDNLKKYKNLTELSREAVVSLLDRVIVIDSKTIKVVFLFDEEIQEYIDYAAEHEAEKGEQK